MTPLGELLIRRIQTTGPITLADYMTDCLVHPEHGYYTTRNPIGARGDFITAPEVSQMFGELIGLSLAQAWLDQGSPAPFTLAELGPGRGTLMADVLRAWGNVPGILEAAQIHLIEVSPTLRAQQRETLGLYDVTWVDTVNDLPDNPLFIVANEFFDALPIRQFSRDEHGWRERLVGVENGALTLGLGAATPYAALEHRLHDTTPGDIVETRISAIPIVRSIAERMHQGAALIIDYGDWRSIGDTLQALEQHEMVNIVARPGMADLTAHVDFEVLAQAATPLHASPLSPQGIFLERLGITKRAQNLAQKMAGDALNNHIAAHRRLTHPDEMGTLFKVLGLTPKDAPPLPGLEP